MKIRRLLFILCISVGFFIALGGTCAWSGYQTVNKILKNNLTGNPALFKWCFNGLPFVDQLDKLLNNKQFVILLQNNYEIRPSGGFMGSFAVIETTKTGISKVSFQDIYVPDGQLVGHVDSPLPIEQAFGQGWWKLRDSNWDPDFTVAAPQIAWFFDQGKQSVDGLVAVNFSFINTLAKTLGLFKNQDLYNLTQSAAETNSFAGSTQKSDFLNVVGDTLLQKLEHLKLTEMLPVAKLFWKNLKSGEIMLWFPDTDLQKTLAQRHWDGALDPNYLYIVDTNLGANKANCCVTRTIAQDNGLHIAYTNISPAPNPIKPIFWGGNYIDYLRIVLPRDTQIKSVKVANKELILKPLEYQYGLQQDRYQVEDRGQFEIIGFWVTVPFQQSVQVDVQYDPISTQKLLIKNQPGWTK